MTIPMDDYLNQREYMLLGMAANDALTTSEPRATFVVQGTVNTDQGIVAYPANDDRPFLGQDEVAILFVLQAEGWLVPDETILSAIPTVTELSEDDVVSPVTSDIYGGDIIEDTTLYFILGDRNATQGSYYTVSWDIQTTADRVVEVICAPIYCPA